MVDIFEPKVDAYILAGTYDDSKSFVNQEACKALANYPDNTSPTLLSYPVSSFGSLPEIRKIMINGPKSRLEKEVEDYEISLKERMELIDESGPGDLTQGIDDCIINLKERYDKLSDYVFVIASDFAKMNKNMARIVYNKLTTDVLEDIEVRGSPREIYFSVGNQIDDNQDYARLRDYKIDRKGLVISSAESLRFGGAILFDKKILKTKKDELQEVIEHFSMRKIKESYTNAAFYWIKKVYAKKGHTFLKTSTIYKLAHNTIKRGISEKLPLLDFLIPYYTIHLKDGDTILSETLGLDIKFVRTPGSADIDDDSEFKSAAEKFIKTRKKN